MKGGGGGGSNDRRLEKQLKVNNLEGSNKRGESKM